MTPHTSPTHAPDVTLSLLTLGGWSFLYSSPAQAATPVLGPSKPLALLVYLALSPGRSARRDHLAELLWADLDPVAARHAIRQTVWYLRHRTGLDLLASNGDQLTLDWPVETDRDAFLAAVEAQDWERAAVLYTGDFLPGFAAPGGAEFEQWADIERGRLRRVFLRVASTLVRQRLNSSRFREAVAMARRARDTEPSAEAGWRLLIEALLSSGDRLGAALEADRLGQWLTAEGREPERATLALLHLTADEGTDTGVTGAAASLDARAAERAANDDEPGTTAGRPARQARPSASHTLVAELVGREREFATILDTWGAARAGPARFVHILGAAGLGKTRLLTDVHARLRAMGARSVLVRANPGDRGVAYAFAADIAAALAALPGSAAVSTGAASTLVSLCPSLSARYPSAQHGEHAQEGELMRRRILALGELAAAVSEEAPVAVLLDDTQWSDTASRQVLLGASARLSSERLLVLGASRPAAETDLSRQGLTVLTLKPLEPSQVGALVASLGALPNEPWADGLANGVHRASGGSPLLVLETLHLVLERGLLTLSEEGWRCADPVALEAALAEGSAVERRVAALHRDQQWLLLLLAVAGAPVTRSDLGALVARQTDAVDRDLAALDQRGFLAGRGEMLEPAHDTIAEAAVAAAAPEARRAAHVALGRAEEGAAERNQGQAFKAARHLWAAQERDEFGRAFSLAVRQARRKGDRRSLRALAAEAVGSTESIAVTAAVRRLPVHVRAGLTTPGRIGAAAAAVALAGLALAALLRTPRSPEVVLVVPAAGGGSNHAPIAVALSDELFMQAGPLDVRSMPQVRGIAPHDTHGMEMGAAVPQPGERWWVFTRVAADAGAQDLFAATPDGAPRRLTATPGDDGNGSWSPDGRWFVFSTDRWNERSASDLAVMAFDSGTVRQLTSGDYRDTSPAWSPDGTRIAFTRFHYTASGPASQLCLISVDGRRTWCVPVRGLTGIAPAGWLDADRVLIVGADSTRRQVIAALDLRTQRATRIIDGAVAWIGADGRFITCFCTDASSAPNTPYVFPVSHPELARRIVVGAEATPLPTTWTRTDALRPWLEKLSIDAPADSEIPVDGAFALAPRGRDQRGEPIAVPASVIEWTSSDTTVAAVDEHGNVLPRRTGALTVTVSAGGWRSAVAHLRVVPPRVRTLITDDWRRGISPAWRAMGYPRPFTTTGPAATPALAENGDSTYVSGVYSVSELSLTDGLGVEVLLSTPIRAFQWQTANVVLYGGVDSTALASWDHSTGRGPFQSPADACSTDIPAGEGPRALDHLDMAVLGGVKVISIPRKLSSGRWWRLRVQVLADGRCAVAINGKPFWVSPRSLRTDVRYHISLQGMSFHARMLFGPVEVWQGVRRDVDWSVLDVVRRPRSGLHPARK